MHLDRRQAGWALLAFMAGTGYAWSAAADADDEEGLPNVFISPCGQPFRAPVGAPYPAVDWFKATDKNGDGRIDHAEFVADAAAFFAVLDLNGDGVLSHHEIAVYEQRIAPEILGGRVSVGAGAAHLWLAQLDRPGPIDPGGDQPEPDEKPKGLDESGQGAAPYNMLKEPEPVLAADFDLNGLISRANFLKLAGLHFTALDQAGDGFLTLARLPKTEVELLLAKTRPRRKRS